MLKNFFVKQGIKEAEIEQFIRQNFPYGDYSRTELQRTPLGLKIVIHTNKPGRIIGRGGKNINEITDAIRVRFNVENPQIDVKGIANPNLDARIVAKQIASALERGYNHKKIGNLTMRRIMGAGAIGAQITIAGKLGGSKGMRSKFVEGYLKHCGQPAKELVDYGFEEANTKPGKIGVQVRIMREFEDITGERKTFRQPPAEKKEQEPAAPLEEVKEEGEQKAEGDIIAEPDETPKPKKAARQKKAEAAK